MRGARASAGSGANEAFLAMSVDCTFEATPVWGALMHTVVIRSDLLYFRHTFTDQLVEAEASLPTYFPSVGKYYDYTQFKPGGGPLITFRSSISTGDIVAAEPALVEDTNPVKTQGWLTFRLLKDSDQIKSGKPTQLVFNVTERGNEVQALTPYLEAPGHLWIVDDKGDNFAHLAGVSESRGMPAPGEGATTPTAVPTEETEGATATAPPVPTYAPTFAPGIINAMATAGAAPRPQLAPVQETALSSILQTPEILPQIGYGPDVAFTHTFPHPGLYKLWLEVEYRAEVIVVDYVLKVE